jgi:chorismate-pyruvate lyase
MLAAADTELLYPLTHFCRSGGRSLPGFQTIAPAEMPEVARGLLVHDGDMTSRLEQHHGGETVLRVLHREHTAEAYRREVLLCLASSGLPVEYGAIEINLSAFSGELRELIEQAKLPLGGLLNRFGVSYHSEPRAFLKLAPDAGLNALFQVEGAHEFYGRSNVLLDDSNQVLAQIVEVLRPAEKAKSYAHV